MVRNRRFPRFVPRLYDFTSWDDGWTASTEGVILVSFLEVKGVGMS